VRVLERSPVPRPQGSGLLLQPPGVAVLERIGVADAVRRGSPRVTRLLSKNTRGRTLLDLDYTRLAPDAHGLGVARERLVLPLYDAARAVAREVAHGVAIDRIEEDGQAARVFAGREELGTFGLVVVAAGTHA
jgi:2-polyprenyl-6-methoxyphenol hydroxylase-like FAD-dependent oxidoreductase